jgi:hypothetical protein
VAFRDSAKNGHFSIVIGQEPHAKAQGREEDGRKTSGRRSRNRLSIIPQKRVLCALAPLREVFSSSPDNDAKVSFFFVFPFSPLSPFPFPYTLSASIA